jgi:hypothetical protein
MFIGSYNYLSLYSGHYKEGRCYNFECIAIGFVLKGNDQNLQIINKRLFKFNVNVFQGTSYTFLCDIWVKMLL